MQYLKTTNNPNSPYQLTLKSKDKGRLMVKSFNHLIYIIAIFLVSIIFSISGKAQSGEALDFSGPNDIVQIGSMGAVENWTVETWFKPPASNRDVQRIFQSNYNPGGSNEGVSLELCGVPGFPIGSLYACVSGDRGFKPIMVKSSSEHPTTEWHHIAIVGEKTRNSAVFNKLVIYYDGIEVVNQTHESWPATFSNFVLGRGVNTQHFRDYNGQLDEFRVWDHARSASDIQATKDQELSGSEPGLMAYYNFNQGTAGGSNLSENQLTDSKGSHNGNLIGFTLQNGNSSNWVAPGPVFDSPCPTIANAYTPQLLPIGRVGILKDNYFPSSVIINSTPVENVINLEVVFIDFSDAPAPSVNPEHEANDMWNILAGHQSSQPGTYKLKEELEAQGLQSLNINKGTSWKRMPSNMATYFPGGSFNYTQFVTDGHSLLDQSSYPENTILVLVPHKDNTVLKNHFVTAGGGANHHLSFDIFGTNANKGIRSTIVMTPREYGDDDDYRALMHEIGHSYGLPEFYPADGSQNHEVGGFDLMGDSRFATGFLGWNRFRFGWLDQDQTIMLNKQGQYNVKLSKLSSSNCKSMLVIPDPQKYTKQWVIELNQEMKPVTGNVVIQEGSRVVVYTVEAPALAGKREVRVIRNPQKSPGTDFRSLTWVEAHSFGVGEQFSVTGAPFTMNITSSNSSGFSISVNLPNNINGGFYPQRMIAGDYEMLPYEPLDLDVIVRQKGSNSYIWSLKGLFPESQRPNSYIAFRNGQIQLIDKNNHTIIKNFIETGAPSNAKIHLTNEGKIQVVDQNETQVYWENMPADQVNDIYTLEFEKAGRHIYLKKSGVPIWGAKQSITGFSPPISPPGYFSLSNNKLQYIMADGTIAEKVFNPNVTKFKLGNKGKIVMVDDAGIEYDVLRQPDP